jgi:hypothetical protein
MVLTPDMPSGQYLNALNLHLGIEVAGKLFEVGHDLMRGVGIS